ncbi:MAG: cupin domain-containing protein [Pseudomonadota bacterium]
MASKTDTALAVQNMVRDLMTPEAQCHDGIGTVHSFRAFERLKSDQRVDFIDFVRIPPGASIGRHFHGNNREWYTIIRGEGEMWFKGETVRVKPWDVLINPPHHEHGLVNNSDEEIVLVVFETSDVPA